MRCPQCNFTEMIPENVCDVGVMAASPVIVFFAPSRFKDQVPFALGYVFLKDFSGEECDTALLVRARTTTGMVKPGIFKKDTPVKIVFCDEREGSPHDMFVVPQAELTTKQIAKTPLLESDLSLDQAQEPVFFTPSRKRRAACAKVGVALCALGSRVLKSPRAQSDLANWKRNVLLKTGGGDIAFAIDNGKLIIRTSKRKTPKPDLVLAIEDPAQLLPWLEGRSALTNLVMEGTLWVNKPELETITRLDRLPRSLRRDGV